MLVNEKTNRRTKTASGFYAAAPVVPVELVKKAKKIAADRDGNAFWIETMRRNAAKHEGTSRACAPSLMRTLETAGRRLERDGGNNYALTLVTAQILNEVYQASVRGDDCFKKYFPIDKKTGEPKNILFKSEYFCQSERADHVPVLETENGFVRSKIHTCGKAWSCPVCAAKIAVRRNAEIVAILKKARSEGMTSYMITLTAPHYSHQRLLYISEKMQAAYAHFDNSRSMKNLRKRYGFFGKIKTMETMCGGKNGWHNHFHVVYIFDYEIDNFDEIIIEREIKEQWLTSCASAGILNLENTKQVADFRAHAVTLKRDFDPNYIAKQSDEWKREYGVSERWGIAEELTFSHIKKGDGSCTAFGFVARMARMAAMGLLTFAEMRRGAELYIEYCCAMKGRSMIQCSKGLKEWAGLKEKNDKTICNEMKDRGEMIGAFDKDQHIFVRKNALWRPFKKLLATDQELAIKEINAIFKENGLKPFYSPEEIERYIYVGDDDDIPGFSDPVPPPKMSDEIGEVCPATPEIMQLKLFEEAA